MQANTSTIIQSSVSATDIGPRLSGNGRYAAFTTNQDLSGSDGNLASDVYVRDLQSNSISLVSSGAGSTAPLAGASSGVSLSTDGQTIAFQYASSNNALVDVMVKNIATGTLVNASTNSSGADANGHSYNAAISGNGRYVAYLSKATNLVATDTNGHDDVFVKDLQTGAVRNISTTAAGVQADADSKDIAISSDGKLVAFTSYATNLVPNDNSYADIFVKDTATASLQRISTDSFGNAGNGNSDHATFSANGRYVVFASEASNLVDDDTNGTRDVFRKDLQTGQTVRVSTTADGMQVTGDSGDASISADGRYVVFSSTASFTPGDTDGKTDIFIKDMQSGAVSRLSQSGGADDYNYAEGGALAADSLTVLYTNYKYTAGKASDVRNLVKVNVGAGFGDTAGQTIAGGTGADVINANQGADRISGLGGNDVIDGGGGADTVVFQGARANYTVTRGAGGLTVTDSTGVDGTDILANVERLHFANADIAYDVNGTAGSAYRIYQAAFDRAPDAAGFGYWINKMDQGLNRFDVAYWFMASEEAQARFGIAPKNADVLTEFYQHVLHRAPEAAGYNYWLNVMDAGKVTQSQVLAYFADSAENQAALVGTMQNGMAFTPWAG
ncbi:hypothetical protein GCM10027277_37360 [Pseudoduganella ginsengisoli]|uniref:DUF4214 domain-containing protein n=1 Tax=Pseudoduganella ginsengisoli TaxID=1462440 RepID=A0A6L6PYL9_9BURK|nr:DUF4214 domain-containing protein [Pseudoduganella ginsengisoli]MTW02356.1 DUF4214 domain-containing protein [Pseudoduganella ginsengisoli]